MTAAEKIASIRITAATTRPAPAQSARGLFRATGKQAREERPREERDFYPTPPEPTRAILNAEAGRLAEFPLIWEPACGDGAMAREMTAAGHAVIASDVVNRGCPGMTLMDYFTCTRAPAQAMLTNPPYDCVNFRDGKGRWITHAMDTLGLDYMALLLSWSWPGAGGLSGVWSRWPPARVYLMRWKIDFTGAGAPPMLNGWFIWDRAHRGETVLRMLDRADDARQGALI